MGMHRRALLAGGPLAALTLGTLPAAARPADPLPGLLALRAQRQIDWIAEGDRAGDETPETEAAWAEYLRVEEAIETTVATTPEGIAAQIEYMRASYGPGMEGGHQAVDGAPFAFLDVILAGLRGL